MLVAKLGQAYRGLYFYCGAVAKRLMLKAIKAKNASKKVYTLHQHPNCLK